MQKGTIKKVVFLLVEVKSCVEPIFLPLLDAFKDISGYKESCTVDLHVQVLFRELWEDGLQVDIRLHLQKLYEDATQVASDAVGSIRTVASFSAEDKVIQLYEKKCKGPVRIGVKQGLYSGIGYGLSMFLLYAVYATIFYAGAQLIKAGKTSYGEVFQVNVSIFPSFTFFTFQNNVFDLLFSFVFLLVFTQLAGFLWFEYDSH